jgi:hypothetical protein
VTETIDKGQFLDPGEESMREHPRRRFPDELRAYMDASGIESLTELHRLYLEAGGKLDLGTFKRHAGGEGGYLTPEFISPLFDALGLSVTGARGEESSPEGERCSPLEGSPLLLAYGLAYRRSSSR